MMEARLLLSGTPVLNFHNDAAGTGANLTETVLNPGNVNASQFGKLFSTKVDGQVYAQPLYVPGLNVTGGSSPGVHNVVFAATEHDSLYAIDSTTGAILWQDSFLVPEAGLGGSGATVAVTSVPSGDVNTTDISPEIGITSTPAIDATTGSLYLTAKTKQVVSTATTSPHYVYTLYKVNIASGTYTSTLIADTTRTSTGAYVYNSGPFVYDNLDPNHQGDGVVQQGTNFVINFNTLRQMNRAAVTLNNGNVYLGFASHGDNTPYHGWILGYNEGTLAPTAVFNANPDGNDDGIWQSGGKLSVDSTGAMYFETGNGKFDTTLNAQGFPQYGDYGDSFVKVVADPTTSAASQNVNGWGLKVADYFTPQNQASLSSADEDLGSGGPLVLPETVGTVTIGNAAHPDLLVGAGKEGKIYLIDRNNMGHYSPTTDNVVQEMSGALPGSGSFDAPALYYDGTTARFYYIAAASTARSFSIANAQFSLSSASTDTYGSRDATTSISANGTTNGIAWNIDPQSNQLRAYSASNYATELYTSAQAAGGRDALGSALKFTAPTIADGEVFVGTNGALVTYAPLVAPTQPPSAPTNLTALAVSGVQVNLSWQETSTNVAGYNIFESTDGGKTFGTNPVTTAGAAATSVAVTGLTAGQTYTFVVQAFNAKGRSPSSNQATATTLTQSPTVNFSNGFANAGASLQLNGTARLAGSALELTDGGGTEAGSAFTTFQVADDRFTTNFSFVLTNASADGFTFTLQSVAPTELGGSGGGLGYALDSGNGGIPNSVAIKFDLYNNAGEGTDSTGLFVDGDSPTIPAGNNAAEVSVDMSSTGINLHSGHVMNVSLTYDGTTLQETITDPTANATFTQSYTVNLPSILGGTSAYAGFTGGTGGLTALQVIDAWTYTPLPAPPATPTGLTVTPGSGTELDLAWSEPSTNVDHFNILRLGTGGTYVQIGQVSGNTLTYRDTGLTQNQSYSYEVVAVNAGGSSAPAGPVSGTTPFAPAAVTNLQATNVTATSALLTWTNNATNAQGIKIVRQRESDNSQLITTLAPTATSYPDATLVPGTAYEYTVVPFNAAGPSAGTVVDLETIPDVPTGLTATASETGATDAVTLNWTAPKGAASYNIYRGTSPGGEGATPIATGVTGTTYTDANLAPGTRWYYTVAAVDPSGVGAPSTEASANANLLDVITLNAADKIVTLVKDTDGQDIDWTLLGLTGIASKTYRVAINDPNGLTINGGTGIYTLTLDRSNGDPLPNALHISSGTYNVNGLFATGVTDPLAGHTLDVGGSTLYLDDGGLGDLLPAVQRYLTAGYNGGHWSTTATDAITSDAAAANPGYAIGYADSAANPQIDQQSSTIELKYTLQGDANLDGKVDVVDLGILATNFPRQAGATWAQGDFNYDGKVDVVDLGDLATEFGKTAVVPGSGAAAVRVSQPSATRSTVRPIRPSTSPFSSVVLSPAMRPMLGA